ncbi:MAG: DEAD/DEAH box helicase [Verrucomicrobiae bacterium]|nr:DEAD/DEAH box helicase [Verrucomicrobiae bacterium]
MLPFVLASQIERGVQDFLRTMFSSSTPLFSTLLDDFLAHEDVFKGPYLSLALPFRQGRLGRDTFGSFSLPFPPHLHQEMAFANLQGDHPKSTLVATGTGSGKTECFLFPILDHCLAQIGKPGIKALVIYPMNALATDQAERFAKAIFNTPELRGKITVGLYVGQSEREPAKAMGSTKVITCKETMRLSPPDILLTNYKMLDYLLIRPTDAALWSGNAPESLRYLVVDELHTFDGAQGTDLACLIRRLKDRLRTPTGHLCCVGTSATLGNPDSGSELRDYAQKIFGEPFEPDSLIVESRLTPGEFLGDSVIDRVEVVPVDQIAHLDPANASNKHDFIRSQYRLWFGEDAPDDFFANASWLKDLGQKLKGHLFFQNLIRILKGKVTGVDELLDQMDRCTVGSLHQDRAYRRLLLESLVSLICVARIAGKAQAQSGDEVENLRPFLDVRVQLWMRELGRVVVGLDAKPYLKFSSDLSEQALQRHVPVVHCRECGAMGWLGYTQSNHGGDSIGTELKEIYRHFFSSSHSRSLMIFPEEAENDQETDLDGTVAWLCPGCLTLRPLSQSSHCKLCETTEQIRVFVPNSHSHDCPYCGAYDSLTLLGSRAAALTSTMIAQLFGSAFNDDKKLLTFSDNVQDAAHRAGFFSARTYGFNLRTAIQRCLQEIDSKPTLSGLPDYFAKYWQERMDLDRYIATFIAPNMEWFSAYDALKTGFIDSQDKNRLLESVNKRLAWEIASEFTFDARIGRTLEKSSCAIVVIDHRRLEHAFERIRIRLANELEDFRDITIDQIAPFVLGLCTRMKNMGAVALPLLDKYRASFGKEYLISQKHIPWMQKIGPNTRAPRMLTTKVGTKRFDALFKATQKTWYEKWAGKHFYVLKMLGQTICRNLYALVLEELERAEILDALRIQNQVIWALRPDALGVSLDVIQIKCRSCGHKVSIPADELEAWQKNPCLRNQCKGHYAPLLPERDYYGRLYRTGDVERLFTEEHTGLLDRPERERIESAFKADPVHRRPWDANLLSCTPTMEMGIDIGDLSTTIQCSVPPAQANYLQRIGRAGRRDGNGLNLTIANIRPHDQYFFADPLRMLSGDVDVPGVFLGAAAVLERQFLAYCFDRWVAIGIPSQALPPNLGVVLDNLAAGRPKAFPQALLDFVEENRDDLFSGFIGLFPGYLSPESESHLDHFAHGSNQEESLGYKIVSGLQAKLKERTAFKSRIQRMTTLIKRKMNDPAKDKNYDDDLREMQLEKRGLQELVKNINSKNIFNFFTDEGLLPNYAFPEQGVTLHSVIYRKKSLVQDGSSHYETFSFEYERAAASALHDLAPNSTFYAGKRRVTVDQVDLKLSETEIWRLCSDCAHAELGGETSSSACPRCGSTMWPDEGRKRRMLRLRQVFATTPDYSSRISDDSDERDPIFHVRQMLVDYEPHDIQDAYRLDTDETVFGYEFLGKATFRDINFGPYRDDGDTFTVAGEERSRYGFWICEHCGKVQNKKEEIQHSRDCPSRKPDNPANKVECVYLYREFQSEAIKILLPIIGGSGSEDTLHSFVAALHLGLKKQFKGNISHLSITKHSEPILDTNLRKQFLVLYDTVPGGTGYLKQLMQSGMLLTILRLALENLRSCSCQNDESLDGCYRCLLGYQNSNTMRSISRKKAITILSDILQYEEKLIQVKDLRNVTMNVLFDSELENMFIKALQKAKFGIDKAELIKKPVNGKPGYSLKIGEQHWIIEPQVNLGPGNGVVIPCRADFVISPARSSSGFRPIVVFTDGFAFHRDRIGADLAQRMAVTRSGKFRVWSLTYKDVLRGLKGSQAQMQTSDWRTSSAIAEQAQIRVKLQLENDKESGQSSLDLLLAYLNMPDDNVRSTSAFDHALCLLNPPVSQDKVPAWSDDLVQTIGEELAESLMDISSEVIAGQLDQSKIIFRHWLQLRHAAVKPKDITGLRLVWLLDDQESSRSELSFESTWSGFLRLSNIFQFIPGAVFLTSTGIEAHVFDFLTVQTPGNPMNSGETIPPDDRWIEAREFSRSSYLPLLDTLQSAGVPAPIVGYEIMQEGKVAGEAEMAWEEECIAILEDGEDTTEKLIQGMNWTVLKMRNVLQNPNIVLQFFL